MSAEETKSGAMGSEEMIALCKQHSMYTWTRGDAVDPIPVARAEGVYLYTPEGHRLLDFNSQLMCVNIGHSHPKVLEAMKQQLDRQLLYVYPGTATEPRARLARRLAEILPDPINTFFFTLGGAEANENAIKAARLYTGRHKILSRYRSYHGATHACMQLTGDPRRWHNEPGPWGFVRVMDPVPYDYSFGATDEEQTRNHLAYLEDLIKMEGPDTIAAMFVEAVTGTNGVLPPPKGWLKGLHALLKKYGILLVCDEVMAGFGRTGKWFAFEHGEVVPDIVTMAKGLTSSYAPLGAMGVSDAIAAHFKQHVFWGGLTYNAHPFSCAAGEAAIKVLQEEGLVERAAKLEPIVLEHMARLKAKHRSVKTYRSIGLFGVLELQKNAAGETLAPFNGSHPAIAEMAKFFRQNGLFTFIRWFNVMCNPPLCITEEQLAEGFDIIDRGLEITDAAFEG